MTVSLISLYKKFDSCERCKKFGNKLQHILGGGCTENLKICFILINPTYNNISSNPNWTGKRFPFVGVKHFWKVIHDAGLLSKSTLDYIYKFKWTEETSNLILKELNERKLYFTNLVKCCGSDGANPSKQIIREDLPLLLEEISLVNPERIITFGALPFKALTGADIKLNNYLEEAKSKGCTSFTAQIKGKIYPVHPCFFPVGQGSPKKAVELLKIILAAQQSLSEK